MIPMVIRKPQKDAISPWKKLMAAAGIMKAATMRSTLHSSRTIMR